MIASTVKMDYIEQLAQDMIFIEGNNNFQMKSENWGSNKKLERQVKIADFYLCKYPVTQGLWQAVMGDNPSYFKGANRPVEQVSWDDAQVFLEKLNKISGKTYRLPSEAEWEYAARGGARSLPLGEGRGGAFSGSNKLKEVGWYSANSHGETKPVGLKLPNELGLYDMSGNVWEWCADVWHDDYKGAPKDGSAWLTGGSQNARVVRGGSWFDFDFISRVSFRSNFYAVFRYIVIGFRLAGY